MITVSVEDIQTQIACFTNICKSGALAPLLYDSFIAKTHPVIANLLNKQYPCDVKVPKSLQALAGIHNSFREATNPEGPSCD